MSTNNTFDSCNLSKIILPVKLPIANKKKRTVKEPNTNCNALLILNVPINNIAVNKPQTVKYIPIAVLEGASTRPILGNIIKVTNVNQKYHKQ